MDDLDEDGGNEDALPLDMLDEDLDFYGMNNNKRKRSGKKHGDEDDDDEIERNYKVNSKLLANNNPEVNGSKKKLLPIKTDRGVVQQFMDVDGKKDKKKIKKDEADGENGEEKVNNSNGMMTGLILDDDNKDKSLAQIIFEKKQNIEITKAKVASLSRAIIGDPHQEVQFFFKNVLK